MSTEELYELLDESWTEMQASSPVAKWRNQNPREMGKLLTYREGGNRPDLVTHMGKGFVADVEAWLALQPTPVPPTPEPTPPGVIVVDAPRTPYTFNIKDSRNLGLNVTTKQDIHDGVIDGTGETGVLFQGGGSGAAGSTIIRVKMSRVAAFNSVSYGKHAIYGKAANLLMQDIYAECSGYCASCYSIRYDGAVLRDVYGAGASHLFSLYDSSKVKGTVLIENAEGSFTGDAAMWCDAETDFQQLINQEIIMRNVHVTGPGAWFLKIKEGRMTRPARIESCTLNGKPVTDRMVAGIPNLSIV